MVRRGLWPFRGDVAVMPLRVPRRRALRVRAGKALRVVGTRAGPPYAQGVKCPASRKPLLPTKAGRYGILPPLHLTPCASGVPSGCRRTRRRVARTTQGFGGFSVGLDFVPASGLCRWRLNRTCRPGREVLLRAPECTTRAAGCVGGQVKRRQDAVAAGFRWQERLTRSRAPVPPRTLRPAPRTTHAQGPSCAERAGHPRMERAPRARGQRGRYDSHPT